MTRPPGYGLPEPALAQRRFERAAATFDAADFVGAETAARLLERLGLFSIAPHVVVDLGAATARASRSLARIYPAAQILAIDSSRTMLAHARLDAADRGAIAGVAGDAEQLPCRDDSADLVFANLLLPWAKPDRVLAECARVLKPGGLLLVSSLGPDTLVELRRAWARADEFIHVHGFVDMHDIGDLASRSGFSEPVVDVDRLTLRYADVAGLVADLRSAGASNSAVGRCPGLMGRSRWAAFEAALARDLSDGRIGVTIELVFLQAWAADHGRAAARSPDTVVRIPAETLVRGARNRR